MTILDQLAEYARQRVAADKEKVPLHELIEKCKEIPKAEHRFYKALKKDGLGFICEVKKASPSKGIISEEFLYMKIAREYEAAGADCISCLTEPKWFMGSDEIFMQIRAEVKVPMIRKDFTVDEYQIYQAHVMGTDAVLLICSLLDNETITKYIGICDELGLDALVETHDEKEIENAISAGARIIGVNNRNLKDFSVDISNSERLRALIPKECLYVAESGISSVSDVGRVKAFGADAVLMGEVLMRAEDKAGLIKQMRDA